MNSISFWQKHVAEAEAVYDPYHRLVAKTRQFYKDQTPTGRNSGHYNLFWSTIETLKPFLYFKRPDVHIERLNKFASPAEKCACRILEKVLNWSISQGNFDSVLKYARNDFLISGAGIVWERYLPEFSSINGQDIKISDSLASEYIDPASFIADCDNVGIWEDVSWIGRRLYMSLQDIEDNFGTEALKCVRSSDQKDKKEYTVYEIWDKSSKTVLWFEKNASDFFKVLKDPLHLKDFFPCPRPLLATLTNDSIIPVPDYCLIQEQLEELNGINHRMKMLIQAFKISGAYDSSFPDLQNILEKENVLVALKDFLKLKENGGIRGVIDFMPLEQYVSALEELAARRQDIMVQIYNITGISDIMRGASTPLETATAVIKKVNFGNLRNQDRQNDMQYFVRNLFRIKAEIISELFSDEFLISFLAPEERKDVKVIKDALFLLRHEKIRGMSFVIETENMLNQEAEFDKTSKTLRVLNDVLQNAMQNVSAQPVLLPFYRTMVESVIQYLPKSCPFESVIGEVFGKIEAALSAPQVNPVLKLEEQKVKNIYEIEKEKNMLKAKELTLKAQDFQSKNNLTQQEIDLGAHLKKYEIDQKKPKTPQMNFLKTNNKF